MGCVVRFILLFAACSSICLADTASLESAIEKAERLEEQEKFEEVLRVLSPHAESGDARVQYMRAHALWLHATEGKDPDQIDTVEVAEAVRTAELCAAREAGDCLNLLYLMHSLGIGIPADREKALGFLRRAVEANDDGAKLNYAIMLYTGAPMIDKDVDLACKYFLELVESPAGAIVAYYLGVATFRGQCGRTADPEAAIELIRVAAKHGVKEAQRDMGKNYEFGWATKRDPKRAVQWYKKAAAQGDGESLWRLGMAHVTGEGLKKDSVSAVDYFRQAANAGYGGAKVSLAVMYATGDGVARDYKEAKRLYEEAAEMGESHAYYGLAVMHARGEGMPADLVKARALYALALALGDRPNAAFVEQLEAQMTDDELGQAEQLFSEWMLERESE